MDYTIEWVSKQIPLSPTQATNGPNTVLYKYFYKRSPVFRYLNELKEKGWLNPIGKVQPKQQRECAEPPVDAKEKWALYNMYERVGDEMEEATRALSLKKIEGKHNMILDLCMAPGGFSASALKHSPKAFAFGFTLPPAHGGLDVMIRGTNFISQIATIIYKDITMFAAEFGVEQVPEKHPDAGDFTNSRPLLGHKFELVFCDGQPLKSHVVGEHRQKREPTRLLLSQLILALQRVTPGGTIIVLLHKPEAWNTACFLYQFDQFAGIELFKSKEYSADGDSFYLIAKNVQPESLRAQKVLQEWKEDWTRATFGGPEFKGADKIVSEEDVNVVMNDFGLKLWGLADSVWTVQARAMINMGYMPPGSSTSFSGL